MAHLVVCVPLVFQSENCPGAVQAHACYFHKLCPVEFDVSSPAKKTERLKKSNAGRLARVERKTPPYHQTPVHRDFNLV